MTDRARDKDTVWSHAALPAFPPLAVDHTTTVCVVGAGVAGLTTAYLLAKEGSGVVVLDDGLVGGGESGLTTAQLVTALDRRWADLARLHSREHLRVAAASHAAAIDRIERIVREEEIACELQRLSGYLFAAPGQSADVIHAEIAAAHEAGLGLVRAAERAPLLDFDTGPAACFPDQAQLHVLRYLAGLARAVERSGGRIYTEAHVTEVDEETEGPVLVKTDRGVTVRADHVVLATNTPFLPRLSIHLKQTAYRTYVIALPVPRGSVVPALYWDTEEPLHYVRLTNLEGADSPEPLLLVGGEDHRTGVSDDDADRRYARLEAWARERFPVAGRVLHRWSGQVMETVDGLGYIGRLENASRVFVATGDCGTGMTHGTIAGIVIDDLVHGRRNAWADTYAPGRVNLSARAVSGFVKTNLRAAGHYADWLAGGDVADVERLPPGAGGILRRGLHMVAVYRDPQGRVHERSAVCPHLGCVVAWNASERTWDCPCHGSRFDCTGRVLHGPATADLAHVEGELAKAG
jgi:glycine/D-amino acid oxidase-like deaminating enzyme/nitrite reductase/ring-hydroxylating ferredoxin subunit